MIARAGPASQNVKGPSQEPASQKRFRERAGTTADSAKYFGRGPCHRAGPVNYFGKGPGQGPALCRAFMFLICTKKVLVSWGGDTEYISSSAHECYSSKSAPPPRDSERLTHVLAGWSEYYARCDVLGLTRRAFLGLPAKSKVNHGLLNSAHGRYGVPRTMVLLFAALEIRSTRSATIRMNRLQ